jgi:antitoxin ParD1/3/4
MNVNLTPHLEAMVRQKVESGRYNNASEVVREALRLLEEQDNLHRLRAALAIGQDQLDRGEDRPYTPELLEELKRQATENARLGSPIPDEIKP